MLFAVHCVKKEQCVTAVYHVSKPKKEKDALSLLFPPRFFHQKTLIEKTYIRTA